MTDRQKEYAIAVEKILADNARINGEVQKARTASFPTAPKCTAKPYKVVRYRRNKPPVFS